MDDLSRLTWTFLLKSKDDACNKFKEWKMLIENHTDKKIKALKTDNDMKFYNALCDNLCVASGILRQKSVGFTAQQNGVDERMTRTHHVHFRVT